MGINPTEALVMSQVVLSLVLPVPMIAQILLVFRRDLMAEFMPGRTTRVAALVGTAVVLGLNMVLLAQTVGG